MVGQHYIHRESIRVISEALFLITNRVVIVGLLHYGCLNEKKNYSGLVNLPWNRSNKRCQGLANLAYITET